jgi:hypothetical protein
MLLEERCYVVYGKGFAPFKIKGYSNKNTLVIKLKLKGFNPKSSLLNCDSYSGKKCKTTPTLYVFTHE